MFDPDKLSIGIEVGGTYFGWTSARANTKSPPIPKKVLAVGQMDTVNGSATPGIPIQLPSRSYIADYVGSNSQLAWIARCFLDYDPITEFWLLPLADAGGAVAAEIELTFTGPATEAGTIDLDVGGMFQVAVAVGIGDTATEIAANTVLAITETAAIELGFPVTAESALGVVTATVNWAGLSGNEVAITVNRHYGQKLPAGVGLTIGAAAGGATDPTLTTPWSTLADMLFTDIINPYTGSAAMNVIETDMDEKFGITQAINGHVYIGYKDNLVDMKAYGDSRNSPFVSVMPAGYSSSPGWVWAADVVGAWTRGDDPSRSIMHEELMHVAPPPPEDRLAFEEMNGLLRDNGYSSYKIGQDGKVRIDIMRTMYQVDGNNNPNAKYKMHKAMKLLFAVRYRAVYRLQPFTGWKLAPDSFKITGNKKIMQPKLMRTIILDLAKTLEEDDNWLIETELLAPNTYAEIDLQNPTRMNVYWPLNFIQHLNQIEIQGAFKDGYGV